ncbi:MAG: bacterial/archaeal transporter family-2 protein [Sphingomonadales bacterium]|jgi:transporter family-2 protein|nr:bacterial/archaeal transporter family-2 protein [Sphingomonadales bacterium]
MNPLWLAAAAGAFLAGALIALQAPTNAMLSRAVASPVNAALVSFAVGLAALAAAALALGARPDGAAVRGLPWYAWTGGVYGAVFVALAAFAAPRLGVTFFLMLAIGGQLAMALWLDRSGAFGLPVEEISVQRIGGVLLVLAGAWLVQHR